MTGPQAAAPPSVRRTASRTAGLRQASLAILIVLIVQFAPGIGVNLYVTLPAAGHPGHSSWFGNGPLLALHAALGMFLILAAIFVVVRAIMARNVTSSPPRQPGWRPSSSPPSSDPASPASSPTATPSGWRWPPRRRWPATPWACMPRLRSATGRHDRAESGTTGRPGWPASTRSGGVGNDDAGPEPVRRRGCRALFPAGGSRGRGISESGHE